MNIGKRSTAENSGFWGVEDRRFWRGPRSWRAARKIVVTPVSTIDEHQCISVRLL